MADHEHCSMCDNLTGKAGRGDDSLYTDDGKGPFCDACYSEARITELEAELEDWRESARKAADDSPHDEDHCTCVPLSRKTIADLEQLLTDQSRQIEELERRKAQEED